MLTHYKVDAKDNHYLISKFDNDLDLMAHYVVAIGRKGGLYCSCPHAMNRGTDCRHTKMIREKFLPANHISDGTFYCYETNLFTEPMEHLT
jgi:hypothetical protein